MARKRRSAIGRWSRRAIITAGVMTGGALVVGVAVRPGHRAPRLRPLVEEDDEALLNAWVKIGLDNTVTAIVPHAEMGQGAHSALAQMLADELDADWSQVRVMEAPAHPEYANYALGRGYLLGEAQVPALLVDTVDGGFLKLSQAMDLQITGGSLSVRATGTHAMRVAGAAARDMLIRAAAAEWIVPKDEIRATASRLAHSPSEREAPFATFAAAAARLSPPFQPRLKTPADFKLMGSSVARQDIPAKVDGSAVFGMDVDPALPDMPRMRVATVRACPVFQGKVGEVEDADALALPGVERVVRLGDAVAVVGRGYWHASRGLAALKIRWDVGDHGQIEQHDVFAAFDAALAEGGAEVEVAVGDAETALAGAATKVEATYRVPFLAHAAMEPLNCVAWVRGGVCDVWTGSQNPLGLRAAVADALSLDERAVTIHNTYLGGAFGRRASYDYALQAVRVAKAAGVPVKLVWSREEDIAQDKYRPACVSQFSGGLDASGRPVAWRNRYVNKHEPAAAPHIPYDIANQRIEHASSPTHVPFGVWRSVDHSQHGFFTECFIDELAVAAGQDPYRFRRDLLRHSPRHLRVLDAAAEAADWDAPVPPGRGRGIALVESFGTVVAEVIEVAVADGRARATQVTCAVDAGFAVNPAGLVAQMESGIVYGLSAALHGEVTITEGRVRQSNFHDYPVMRIDEMPRIETIIVNGGGPLGGGGEPGTPPAAPALANAVFAATGVRVRELPLGKHPLRAGARA